MRDKPNADDTHVNTILPNKASSLYAYWRFDGDLKDSSGNDRDLIAYGNFQLINSAKLGSHSAESLNEGDYAKALNINLETTTFTVMTWIKPISCSNWNLAIVGEDFDGSWGGFQMHSTATCSMYIGTDVDTRLTPTDLPDGTYTLNQWQQFVFTYNNGLAEVYKNGQKIASKEGITTPNTWVSFWAGHLNGGHIDDTAIWSVALTELEVKTLFSFQNSSFTELSSSWTPHWDSVVGYWKMDGNWVDSSGHENHGTPNNGVTFDSDAKVGDFSGRFDGVQHSVSIADTESLKPSSEITVSAWIKSPNVGSTWDAVLMKTSSSSWPDGYGLSNYSGTPNSITFWVNNLNNYALTVVELNTWQHIVGTYNGSQIRIYKNGILEDSFNHSDPINHSTSNLQIGSGLIDGPAPGYFFEGRIDDVALFSISLEDYEVMEIYNRQKQKFAGHYESPVIDVGLSSGPWDSISWLTSLPFYKELTGDMNNDGLADSENSADYSSLVGSTGSINDDDLQDGIVGLWHFNESTLGTAPEGNDFKDFSGKENHGTEVGSLNYGQSGVFNSAINTSSIGSAIRISSNDSLNNLTSFTYQAWIFPYTSGQFALGRIFDKGFDYSNFSTLIYLDSSGRLLFERKNSPSDSYQSVAGEIKFNQWNHVIVVLDPTQASDVEKVQMYVNGKKLSYSSYNWIGVTPLDDSLYDLYIGNRGDNQRTFDGLIDEAALWSRPLAYSEILQLYRRGANRLKLQIRSCDNAQCDEVDWKGLDGTSFTYFSELLNKSGYDTLADQNNDSTIDYFDYILGGLLRLNSPSFLFSDFNNAGLNISNNRYFQYRVIMESNDNNNLCEEKTCVPDMQTLILGPNPRYYGGSPTIVNTAPVLYNNLYSIEINADDCAQFQLSKNGITYYYWNSVNWEVATSDNNVSTLSEIENYIPIFSNQFGAGHLYIKVFLNSDSTNNCTIDNIKILKN